MSLLDEIYGAELVIVEPDYRLAFVWHGGHGVNFHREDGVEVDFFSFGGARKPTRREAMIAINEHIKELHEEEDE